MMTDAKKPWLESADANRDGWLIKLANWYESDWQRVMDSPSAVKPNAEDPFPDRPSVDSLIDQLPAERREVARSTLRSIDQFYRATVASRLSELSSLEAPTRELPGKPSEYVSPIAADVHHHEIPTIESLPAESVDGLSGPSGQASSIDTPTIDVHDQTLDGTADGALDTDRDGPVVRSGANASNVSATEATMDFSVGSSPIGGGAIVVHGKGATVRTNRSKPGSMPSAMATGQMLGDYRIERVLGQGGMGVVYLATQQTLDRLVALKMILGGEGVKQSMLERFEAEAKAIAKFQHENIVRIFETGTHAGMPYFSLEFIEGETLSDVLRDGPMSPESAAKVLESVARALHYSHQRNIIHRDIKPANVLMTTDGVPKVSDFGLAREIERDQSLSLSGAVVGTPGYMAPEQAQASDKIGPPADIWGMGAMLYAMLTGRAPFVGSNPGESVMMLLRDEPVPPSKLRLKVPKDLETICLKCLEKDPIRRYESAETLADDLLRFTKGEPIAARPISRVERVTRWCRRNPRVAVPTALAASLALALAIGGPLAAGTIYQQKEAVQRTNVQLAKSQAEEQIARELAEANEKVAIENETLAKKSQAEAVAAKVVAQQNAESAQAGYKQAVDALKSLVFGVIRKLQDRPGMADVRQELLATAREGLARLDSTASDPTQNNIIAAGTLRRLGDANLQTGRIEAARQCYQRCLEIVSDLDGKGTLPGRFHNLSTAHDLLGQSLKQLGQMPAAKAQFASALDLRRQWLAENPHDDNVRQNVAATLGNLAFVEMELGDLDAAESLLNESAAIRKESAQANLFSLDAQMQYLGAKWSLEKLRFLQGDVETAVEKMKPIVTELDALAEANPYVVTPAWNAGLAHADVAGWNRYLQQNDAAIQHARRSVAMLKKVRETETKNLKLDDGLATSLDLMATCVVAGDPEKAQSLWSESVTLRRGCIASDPDLALPKVMLASTLSKLGQTDEAETILAATPEPETAFTNWWYALAAANAALASAESIDKALAATAIDRGVEAVTAGIAADQLPAVIVDRDPDLEPLRNSDAWTIAAPDAEPTVASLSPAP
jgi:eukaryotic-like serine/threonine-protein kinase